MLRCLCNCIRFVNSTETKYLAQQLKESRVYFDSQFVSLLHRCDVGHVKDSHVASSGRKQRVMDAGVWLVSLSYVLWDLCPDTISPYVRCYCYSYLNCLRLKYLA